MDFHFPRTVEQLAVANRRIVVRCEECQHTKEVAPDVLDMTFGPDFDVYAGFRELEAQLRCEACGKPRRNIDIVDRNYRPAGAVSFEDSVNRQLEMNALVRARGAERQNYRTVRRRRR
jgi:uncharacterized Zn finger protein